LSLGQQLQFIFGLKQQHGEIELLKRLKCRCCDVKEK
jgi:hypothetical protein